MRAKHLEGFISYTTGTDHQREIIVRIQLQWHHDSNFPVCIVLLVHVFLGRGPLRQITYPVKIHVILTKNTRDVCKLVCGVVA